MRVIVTGSRVWREGNTVRAQLGECLDRLAPGDTLTVVHGACRSGADAHADAWARWHERRRRVVNEPHPARWERQCRPSCRPGHRREDPRGWDVCPQAGFYRNEDMVHLGADLCLAFIADGSRGASHCAAYAERHGIPVRRFSTTSAVPGLF